jgi:hypothetical protein
MNIRRTQGLALLLAALLQACGGGSDDPPAGAQAESTASAAPQPASGRESAQGFGYLRRGVTVTASTDAYGLVSINFDAATNVNTGDTPVDVNLPVLCFYSTYVYYLTDPISTELRATTPIPGYLLTSPTSRTGSLGDEECKKAFGQDWRMVDVIDIGTMAAVKFQDGSLDPNTRHWIRNYFKPANPWNSPGDTPAGFTDGWEYCASESGFCSFSGAKTVYYGMGDQLVSRVLTNGAWCSNSVFGDPAHRIVKACWVADAPPPLPPTVSVNCSSSSGQVSCNAAIANDDPSAYSYAWFGAPPISGQTGAWVGGTCQRGSSGYARVEATHRNTGARLAAGSFFQCN